MSLSLPRFQSSAQLVDSNGFPTIAFHIWWDTFAKSIETAFNNLSDQVVAIAAAQAAAAAAQTTANTAVTNAATAQTTANTGVANAATAQTTATTAQGTATTAVSNAAAAQSTADTVHRNDAITVSYTAPGNVLTATDAGSDATITIANHSRVYGDNTTVSVTGDTITGLSYSTTYYVYYDQTSRAGGSVTYHADTNINHALPNKAAGRHFVGKVATPAAGGGATTGGAGAPSGGSGVDKGDIGSTL